MEDKNEEENDKPEESEQDESLENISNKTEIAINSITLKGRTKLRPFKKYEEFLICAKVVFS